MTATPRTLEACPSVVYIVYTPGPDSESRGYEKWLRDVDNPFFNAIPGIRHYANWKIENVAGNRILDYEYFDFQGLDSLDDLERVWFNADLDRFRFEWVRLWGYTRPIPLAVHAHAYLLRPIRPPAGTPTRFARVAGGKGSAFVPPGANHVWVVDEIITKHFALAGKGPWRRPVGTDNPLGIDWLTLDYCSSLDGASQPVAGAELSFAARLLASPQEPAS